MAEPKTISDRLRQYNAWRRSDDGSEPMPHPRDIGEWLDSAADRLDVLERESREHFEKWHAERRRREAMVVDVERCYRMLLSEPDTKGALFKAENILRAMLEDCRG